MPHPFTTAALWACVSAGALAGSILDTEFNDSDWSAFSINATGGFGFNAGQAGAGGNPGAHRSVTHSSAAGFAQGTVIHTHATAWDPASMGAITSLDMSIEVNCFNGGTSGAVAFGLVVVQGGVAYFGPTFTALTGSGWRTDLSATGLTAASFSGSGTLDFSATGGAISFGFFSSNGTGNGVPIASSSGVDNFVVTIVPAPGAGGALLLAGFCCGRNRRRG